MVFEGRLEEAEGWGLWIQEGKALTNRDVAQCCPICKGNSAIKELLSAHPSCLFLMSSFLSGILAPLWSSLHFSLARLGSAPNLSRSTLVCVFRCLLLLHSLDAIWCPNALNLPSSCLSCPCAPFHSMVMRWPWAPASAPDHPSTSCCRIVICSQGTLKITEPTVLPWLLSLPLLSSPYTLPLKDFVL